ncbi:MAG: inosine/xanthosine triphosphatase [Acidobacteriota bacterium]
MIKIAVGSENPVKVACVAEAVIEVWPDAQTIGIRSESLVSAQPVSDIETMTGALNRARHALAAIEDATHGVGVEGGILDTEEGMWAYAWIVIIDHHGRVGRGQSGRFLLPEGVATLIRTEGLELGEADDRFFNRSNSKHQDGAVGILTDGLIDRKALYKPGVIFALIPFIRPELF